MKPSPLQSNSSRRATSPNRSARAMADGTSTTRARYSAVSRAGRAWQSLHRAFRRYLNPWTAALAGDGLRQRVEALRRHEPALREHGTAVEQAFVAVGTVLQEQTRLAAELVQHGRHFTSFTADSAEANPVRAAIALIDETLKALESFRQESSTLTERLRVQHEEIAKLRQNGAQLERAIAPLRIVDTLFRIEAAGLPSAMQTAFSALTQEIAQLDLRVRETFLQHFEALGVTRQAIASVVEHLSTQRAENDRIADEQHTTMRRSLAALGDEIAWLRRRDARSTELVAQIDRDTNGIVVGLQYQDITRQKLEHVVAALGGLAVRAAGKTDSATLAFFEQATRLEASQLAAIDEELRKATETIDAGAREVVARLDQLEGDGLDSSDCREVAAKVEGTVASLLDMLAQLRGPIERAVSNAEAAARAVNSFDGLTADLGDTIRELTWGIRLIALNAQVQAAQVQRCDGLEVLARHTYLVSEETSRYGETLGRDIAGLTARLGEVVAQAASFRAKTEAARQRLDTEAARVTSDLTRQREAAVDALGQFSPLFSQIREHARRLVKGATLATVNREPLRRAEADLREMGAWCAERGGGGTASNRLSGDFARLHREYTMASEREIHQAVINGDEGAAPDAFFPPAVQTAGATATPALEARSNALGDNVELF